MQSRKRKFYHVQWWVNKTLTVQAVDVNSLCLCPVLCIIWIRNACCRNVAEYSSSKQLDVLVPMLQLFHLFFKQWSDYNLKLQMIYQACILPKSSEFLSKAFKTERKSKVIFSQKVLTFLGYKAKYLPRIIIKYSKKM